MDEFVYGIFEMDYEWSNGEETPIKELAYIVKTEKDAFYLTVGTNRFYEKIPVGKYLL